MGDIEKEVGRREGRGERVKHGQLRKVGKAESGKNSSKQTLRDETQRID